MFYKSVLEDFHNTIIQAGYDLSDFELTRHKDPPAVTLHVVTGKVTVTRKSNGRTKEYQAFSGSIFPADFAEDLQKRVFG